MNTLLDPFEINPQVVRLPLPVPVPVAPIDAGAARQPPAPARPLVPRDSWSRLRCWCSED